MPYNETITALATPSGVSALAIVRVSGGLVPTLHRLALSQPDLMPRVARLARYTALNGDVLDQVVIVYYADGKSYTGEEMLEISSHGNPFILQKILQDLIQRGCRMAEPGEFTKTAFLNGKLDLTQAEAVAEMIHARSDRALQIARKQLEGSVGERIDLWIQLLLQLVAHIEAYIDFPEEDLPPEDQEGPAKSLSELIESLDNLIATSQYAPMLKSGVRTVILGAPNAGKSSLLNALLGTERALVSPEAGTTRDYLEDHIHIGPYLLLIVDTAGIREHATNIEQRGIDKSLQQLERADVVLWVLDSTLPSPTLSDVLKEKLERCRTVVIENKCDLIDSNSNPHFLPKAPHVPVSAEKGTGIGNLRDILEQFLATHIEPSGNETIVVSARHAQALNQAKASLITARELLRRTEPAELVATELRLAIDAMGDITGKIDNERVLDELFGAFCIGK